MASTLIGILSSAERIGKAQAVLEFAKAGDELRTYTTEEAVTQQCIRNSFMDLVVFKNVIHPPSQGDCKARDVMLQLIDWALHIESWTLGQDCAWFTGELEGYHYTAYFKASSPGYKMGYVRISMDEIAHKCLDCT
jgi:hypothetical protein